LEDYLVDLPELTVMELEIIAVAKLERRSRVCVWLNGAEVADVNNKQAWSDRWEQWR
jgi:hypothetical protein